jgi:hypothetical protein
MMYPGAQTTPSAPRQIVRSAREAPFGPYLYLVGYSEPYFLSTSSGKALQSITFRQFGSSKLRDRQTTMPATTRFSQLTTQTPNASAKSTTLSIARPNVPQALVLLLYRIRACQKQAQVKLNIAQADLAHSRPFRSEPLSGDLPGLKQIVDDFDKWAWLLVNAIRHVQKWGYDMWVLTIHQAVMSGLEVYERCRFEAPRLTGTCRL